MTEPNTPPIQPLGVWGYGIVTQPAIRHILSLAGHPLVPGPSPRATAVAVWGNRPSGRKGALAARLRGQSLVWIEEAFVRGLYPGRRSKHPPYGLLLDHTGVHYDATRPSDLETLLATHPLDCPDLLARAETALERYHALGLGKYLAHTPEEPTLPDRHILIVDQVLGDASVTASGADRGTFLRMLTRARQDYPDHPIVVKTHPATGDRGGYLCPEDLQPEEHWCATDIAPAMLLGRAHRVFTVSSQLGLDAIWAGHRPRLFGTPIYAGWDLSDDPMPIERRQRGLRPPQLFAALMLLAPLWYDPFRRRLTDFETILDIAEAETRAHREDQAGYTAHGMALWKRPHLRRMFGGRVHFGRKAPERAKKTPPALVWGSAPAPLNAPAVRRIEDGFLRSKGLGARLVPPLSLISDAQGLYYDPSHPSLLETLIARSPSLSPRELSRADEFVRALLAEGTTKYGPRGQRPALPKSGNRILVVGQVENDASVTHGATGPAKTNAALLRTARLTYPDACLLYKPHPDVEAGLRPGRLDAETAQQADVILTDTDPVWALEHADRVWTLTSLMGFEALLRGLPVTCLGVPFYAGWGLTNDHAPVPPRRKLVEGVTRVSIAHAALIGAPRYFDPITQRICPPEVALDRLTGSTETHRNLALRLAAKAQGAWVSLRPPSGA